MRLTGPVLSLAEGEGRNAVDVASLGLACGTNSPTLRGSSPGNLTASSPKVASAPKAFGLGRPVHRLQETLIANREAGEFALRPAMPPGKIQMPASRFCWNSVSLTPLWRSQLSRKP